MNRNWGATSLARMARTAPTWQVRPASYLNNYEWLAALWGDWSRGLPIASRTPLGTSIRIDTAAPALMPFPRAGWGFVSSTASVIGATDEPQSSPQLLAAGSLASVSVQPPVGSLQRLLDDRSSKVLRPAFARRKP